MLGMAECWFTMSPVSDVKVGRENRVWLGSSVVCYVQSQNKYRRGRRSPDGRYMGAKNGSCAVLGTEHSGVQKKNDWSAALTTHG